MKRENSRRRALRPFNPNPDCSLGPLTKAEGKVVELIIQAHNNESIGRQLSISRETVKRHVSTILLKLECTNRTEVAVKVLNRQFEEKFRQLVSKDAVRGLSKAKKLLPPARIKKSQKTQLN